MHARFPSISDQAHSNSDTRTGCSAAKEAIRRIHSNIRVLTAQSFSIFTG